MFQIYTEGNADLLLKVTRQCNIRCSYCYVDRQEGLDSMNMSDETFLSVVNIWLRELRVRHASIIITGGEATMLGAEKLEWYFRKIQELASQYEKTISLKLQTNGLLLKDDIDSWIDLLVRYDVDLGISWDGSVPSAYRCNTSEAVFDVIATMLEKGFKPRVTLTIGPFNIATIRKDIDTLIEMGAEHLHFMRLIVEEDMLPFDEYNTFFENTKLYLENRGIGCCAGGNCQQANAHHWFYHPKLIGVVGIEGGLRHAFSTSAFDDFPDCNILDRDPLELRPMRKWWERFIQFLKEEGNL